MCLFSSPEEPKKKRQFADLPSIENFAVLKKPFVPKNTNNNNNNKWILKNFSEWIAV